MRANLNKLGKYFDLRAKISNGDSMIANGYTNSPDGTVDILYDEIFAEITRLLPINSDSEVLDVGCGTGEILYRLSRCCASAVGIDLSKEMVNLAQHKGLAALSYAGNNFPFSSSSFDIVIIYQVFTNLPNLVIAAHILEEACRVVRKGGHIMIGAVPHPQISKLPRHAFSWIFNLKALIFDIIIKTPIIPYYSYDYQFFATVLKKFDVTNTSFYPCTVSRVGWATKYHVIVER